MHQRAKNFLMDRLRKIRLEKAMANWKAKGNARLAEACAIALEVSSKLAKEAKLNN